MTALETSRPAVDVAPPAESTITIIVRGTPAGQGQVTFLGVGRGAKHTNEKTLKPWRRAIIDAALAETGRHQCTDPAKRGECAVCRIPVRDHAVFVDVPVAADITITVGKPKTAPKRTRSYPITRSSTDIDHHARAVLDSLSCAGIFHDDSQVIELTVRKVYPGEHERALSEPGAVIVVAAIGGAS